MGKRKQTADGDGASQPDFGSTRHEANDVSEVREDPRMRRLVKKHKLDQQAESKLCDVLSRWDEEKQYRYYKDLGKVLADAVKPSATVMIMVKKIVAGERLCPSAKRCSMAEARMEAAATAMATKGKRRIPGTSRRAASSRSHAWASMAGLLPVSCMRERSESGRSCKQISSSRCVRRWVDDSSSLAGPLQPRLPFVK
ncbi:unnamed protein product [Effrenium voratum]|nr:unnamed protein product [Effrenium voratum]